MLIHAKSRGLDLDKARHSENVSSLNIVHDAEEAFKFVDFTTSNDILGVVTLTLDANLLLDQCDAIKLDRGHHLLRLLVKEKLDAHAILRITTHETSLIVSVYK